LRRGLGKGLSQFVGEVATGDESQGDVPIEAIVPNMLQPRTRFQDEGLAELAASIREVGVIQPLVVRPIGDDRYELIAGERRWRASKLAGLKRVPVVVRSASSQSSLEMALIENIQREDISAIEAARAYERLMLEFGLKQEDVAQRVGKTRSTVANTIRLLRLPMVVQDAVEAAEITEGHARALLGTDEPERQLAVFHLIRERGLTVRDVERLIASEPAKARSKAALSNYLSAERAVLEDRIARHFGAPTKIKLSAGGGGRIQLDFANEEDFQRILDVLGITL
jgi:ParB family chromosome partitioning protein